MRLQKSPFLAKLDFEISKTLYLNEIFMLLEEEVAQYHCPNRQE